MLSAVTINVRKDMGSVFKNLLQEAPGDVGTKLYCQILRVPCQTLKEGN